MLLVLCMLSALLTPSWASCGCRSTMYNSDGKHNMVYFDRHLLRCGSKGMNRFNLDRGAHGLIRFEYNCCDLPKRQYARAFKTVYTYDGKGNLVYLDRPKVSCGRKGILSGFKLLRNPRHDHVRFNVICNQFRKITCQHFRYTPFNDDGGGRSVFLDRHRVQCPRGFFLNAFQLQRSGNHKQIRIAYKCCRPFRFRL